MADPPPTPPAPTVQEQRERREYTISRDNRVIDARMVYRVEGVPPNVAPDHVPHTIGDPLPNWDEGGFPNDPLALQKHCQCRRIECTEGRTPDESFVTVIFESGHDASGDEMRKPVIMESTLDLRTTRFFDLDGNAIPKGASVDVPGISIDIRFPDTQVTDVMLEFAKSVNSVPFLGWEESQVLYTGVTSELLHGNSTSSRYNPGGLEGSSDVVLNFLVRIDDNWNERRARIDPATGDPFEPIQYDEFRVYPFLSFVLLASGTGYSFPVV